MSRSIIAEVRDVMPMRPLGYGEAQHVAEVQAARFLVAAGITAPPVLESAIAELPKVDVNRTSPFPVSGATEWAGGRWHVVLNGSEPATRQKFSLAHELKHILDHPFVEQIYSRFPDHDRPATIERLCDYFAGCLLMPRPWIEKAWLEGNHHVEDLASTFGVSPSAIGVRLRQLGLATATPRCAVPGSLTYRQRYRRGSWSTRHHPTRTPSLS
jgi:predicted transcriptional regulator